MATETAPKRKNKWITMIVLQGNYGQGWEDLCQSVNWREVHDDLKAYRGNEQGYYRIIRRRVLNED